MYLLDKNNMPQTLLVPRMRVLTNFRKYLVHDVRTSTTHRDLIYHVKTLWYVYKSLRLIVFPTES